jgi:hypothetical protein
MTDLLKIDLQTTPQEDTLDTDLTKTLVNKKQIRLLFPYAQRQEAKQLGAKWNSVDKIWYYPSIDGKLPPQLIKYKCNDIHIEYDDKEYFKQALPSMKWEANRRVWVVNERDYQIFLNL